MLTKTRSRPDLILLLSLLLVILLHPLLDHGLERKLVLGLLIFAPVIVATVRLSQIKGWLWRARVLMAATLVVTIWGGIVPSRALDEAKWLLLAVFFSLTVVGLFSYIKNARSILDSHLYTAVCIYLLLGFVWFAIYSAIDIYYPLAIQRSSVAMADRSSELLYFSLVTLSTIGYGDVVPLSAEVRMLAALEGVTGVLYIAITVALLVSSYKQPRSDDVPPPPPSWT